MIIIFYNKNEEKIYICPTSGQTQVVDTNDTSWINKIPNEDILYVTNGHYFTKPQFVEWLTTSDNNESVAFNDDGKASHYKGFLGATTNQEQQPAAPISNRRYIHPTSNGTVLIEDIHTPKFPAGITFSGKWDFVSVDEVGEDVLEESPFYRILIKKGKLEEVDEQYYQANAHKKKTKISPAEAALNKILIQDSTVGAAEKVADAGGIGNSQDIAIPIYIE